MIGIQTLSGLYEKPVEAARFAPYENLERESDGSNSKEALPGGDTRAATAAWRSLFEDEPGPKSSDDYARLVDDLFDTEESEFPWFA